MRKVIGGMRPKKPIPAITRGYTEELWETTTACWEKDPVKRPTADHISGVLRGAVGRWKPKYGEYATQGDWSPTSNPASIPEEPDIEHDNEPSTPTTSASVNPSQPPAIETPVPALAFPGLVSPIARNKALAEFVPTTS